MSNISPKMKPNQISNMHTHTNRETQRAGEERQIDQNISWNILQMNPTEQIENHKPVYAKA